MSNAVITAGGISVRPHKPIENKVKAKTVETICIQGPDLVWKKPASGAATYTTGVSGTVNNGYTWNDSTVGNNLNPPALNTLMHSGNVTTINKLDVWGICVNRLPSTVVQHANINGGALSDREASLWSDLGWVSNCRKYNRYRVLKCEITFRPTGGQTDNALPVLFGVNRVFSNGEKNNRPISVNKPEPTIATDSTAKGNPFTLFDARGYRGTSHDQCVGGGWIKLGDPREPRVEPFKVTWDRMPWYFNSRYQDHMQKPAYDTTISVTDHEEATNPGDMDSYGRADENLLGFQVDRPVYYEPYIIPMGPLNYTTAAASEIYWRVAWTAKYTVEFSDPIAWDDDIGEWTFSNYQQHTMWNTGIGNIWGPRTDIGNSYHDVFTSDAEKTGQGSYLPDLRKDFGLN